MRCAFCFIFFLITIGILVSEEVSTQLSSRGRLRYYEASDEGFYINDNYASISRISEDTFVQKRYDAQQRLVKEITWQKATSVLSSVKELSYEEDSAVVSIITVDDFVEMIRTTEDFNENGKVVKKTIYELHKKENEIIEDNDSLVKDEEDTATPTSEEESEKADDVVTTNSDSVLAINETETEVEANEQITTENEPVEEVISRHNLEEIDESKTAVLSTQTFVYDDEQRLVENLITFTDKKNGSEKIEYAFKLGEDNADVYTYKNNELKKSKIYSTADDWIETVFFTELLYIKTTYIDSVATLEEVYQNGTKIRERAL